MISFFPHNHYFHVYESLLLGLQMTDVELDARVTALEENGGGGNTQNGNEHCYGDL